MKTITYTGALLFTVIPVVRAQYASGGGGGGGIFMLIIWLFDLIELAYYYPKSALCLVMIFIGLSIYSCCSDPYWFQASTPVQADLNTSGIFDGWYEHRGPGDRTTTGYRYHQKGTFKVKNGYMNGEGADEGWTGEPRKFTIRGTVYQSEIIFWKKYDTQQAEVVYRIPFVGGMYNTHKAEYVFKDNDTIVRGKAFLQFVLQEPNEPLESGPLVVGTTLFSECIPSRLGQLETHDARMKDGTCPICYERPGGTVTFCQNGHFGMCTNCLTTVETDRGCMCPFCRGRLLAHIDVSMVEGSTLADIVS